MDLYVEKEFIDKINNDYINQKINSSLDIIVSILKDYGEVKMYIDCNEDDLRILENENLLIALKTANTSGPIPIDSTFEDYLFSVFNHEQTLIFTKEKKEWFNKLNQKGALCFCYDDYEEKIKDIITNCHIKIDLSDPSNFPFSWNKIEIIRTLIPLNKIIINDSYLLRKKHLEKNLYPLIKSISKNTATSKYFWSNIFPKQDQNKKEPYFNMHDIYKLLEDKYKTSEIKIIHNNGAYYNEYLRKDEYFKDSNIQEKMKNFKFHDRLLYTNFYIIDCAIGFNFDIEKQSNSQIIIETIFEKYSYKRLKNHSKKMDDIFKLLKNEDDKFFYPKI
jgi:hypothetical protein